MHSDRQTDKAKDIKAIIHNESVVKLSQTFSRVRHFFVPHHGTFPHLSQHIARCFNTYVSFEIHFLSGGMTLHFLCRISLYSLSILHTRQTFVIASSRLRVGTNSIRIKDMLWWSTCSSSPPPTHTHTHTCHVPLSISHRSFVADTNEFYVSVSVNWGARWRSG
jgi:hypothetical protein